MSKKKLASNDSEKFVASNWKQLSKKEFQKLTPIQRSRYLAYEPCANPSGVNKSRQRVKDDYKDRKEFEKEQAVYDMKWYEYKQQGYMMGQLKASEAERRSKVLRSKYRFNRTNEINHLISSQPSAIKAVRLQSLLPPIPTKIKFMDPLAKPQRMRVEALMDDTLGIETGRILC